MPLFFYQSQCFKEAVAYTKQNSHRSAREGSVWTMMAANVFLEQGDPSATLQLERLRSYGEGGLCPIYLHEKLGAEERYTVVHKLGSTESSTNWLCRDAKENSYVGVKVHAASSELNAGLKALAASLSKAPKEGMEHLALPLDSFTMSSVNGTHECEVLPLLAPPCFLSCQQTSQILKIFCRMCLNRL